MNILSVSYPLAPVGEDAVGGAEQVLSMLDRALVANGHRSFVIAPANSRVAGQLVPLPPVPDSIDEPAKQRAHQATREAIASSLTTYPIDLIHLHGIDFAAYLPPPGLPTLATLHLPLAWYPPAAFAITRPHTWLHGVSHSQYAEAPHRANLLPPIPNGIDIERFRPRNHKRDFSLFLGRICPEKGVDLAIRACREAGLPLLVGGKVYPYPSHLAYFRDAIEPHLDPCCRFLGPLAMARKTRLLAAARCLIVPSLAPETSSLVAMEALASGTPVVGLRSGALPEIIQEGKTGFLVESEAGLAAAVSRAHELCASVCRAEALQRFSAAAMTARYLVRYRELTSATGTTAPHPPASCRLS